MTKHITIPAQDTRTDWFGDYVEAVEAESGLSHTGDDSQYGVFADDQGNRYEAYVEPSRSDSETWAVRLDLVAS